MFQIVIILIKPYIIKYNTSAATGTCSKYNPNSRIQSNINIWKNHIVANINNSMDIIKILDLVIYMILIII